MLAGDSVNHRQERHNYGCPPTRPSLPPKSDRSPRAVADGAIRVESNPPGPPRAAREYRYWFLRDHKIRASHGAGRRGTSRRIR